MNKKFQLLFVVATGLVLGPLVAQAQGYDYEEIAYPGTPDTQVFGVNSRGDVIGNGFTDTEVYPFVYSLKKGTYKDIPPIAGFNGTSALGISTKRTKVGSVESLDPLTDSGLIINKDGTYEVFSHPESVSFTQARAVNNKGLVTGYRDAADGTFIGFLYNPADGTFTDLVPSFFTIAQGINSRGDIVGSANFLTENDPCSSGSPNATVRYGWLRTKDGAVTFFNVNGGRTSARGITNSGKIAGFVFDLDTGLTKGFVTTRKEMSQCGSISIADADLLQFPGAVSTFVGGIKTTGEVVGSASDGINNTGFVATPQ